MSGCPSRTARCALAVVPRGQGTIEYALLSVLLIGFGAFMATRFTPGMLTAFNDYLHGIYLMLAVPIP